MEWLHLAGDIGASIAILVCLYFIWDLRKEVETLRDRISGGSLPELDTLEGGEEMPQVEGIAALRKEREIYEAGADRRLDDLRSFLKREIRLTY